jgi:hypothetical protein
VSADLSDTIQDIIEWVIRVVSGLGIFLPLAIFAIVNLVNRGRKKESSTQGRQPHPQPTRSGTSSTPQRPAPEAMPFPLDPTMWMDLEPAQPEPRSARSDRDDAYRREDDTLRWGSAFAANDREKAESAFKWGSVFDEERERTKWGWDAAEWSGDFAPKRDSEPKITVG